MKWGAKSTFRGLGFIVPLTLGLGVASAWASSVGSFEESSGDVVIVRGQTQLPAAAGASIDSGDLIRAGSNGQARVSFIDGTLLTVSPGTQIAVDQMLLSADTGLYTSSFELRAGKVRSQVGEGHAEEGTSFAIRTPTAVAETGASDFLMTYFTDEETTEIVSFNGGVAVHNIADLEHRASVVTPGQSLSVSKHQPGVDIRPLQRRHFAQLLDGLDISVSLAGNFNAAGLAGANSDAVVTLPAKTARGGRSARDASDILGGSPYINNAASVGIIFED
jgi:hypothetical protein